MLLLFFAVTFLLQGADDNFELSPEDRTFLLLHGADDNSELSEWSPDEQACFNNACERLDTIISETITTDPTTQGTCVKLASQIKKELLKEYLKNKDLPSSARNNFYLNNDFYLNHALFSIAYNYFLSNNTTESDLKFYKQIIEHLLKTKAINCWGNLNSDYTIIDYGSYFNVCSHKAVCSQFIDHSGPLYYPPWQDKLRGPSFDYQRLERFKQIWLLVIKHCGPEPDNDPLTSAIVCNTWFENDETTKKALKFVLANGGAIPSRKQSFKWNMYKKAREACLAVQKELKEEEEERITHAGLFNESRNLLMSIQGDSDAAVAIMIAHILRGTRFPRVTYPTLED